MKRYKSDSTIRAYFTQFLIFYKNHPEPNREGLTSYFDDWTKSLDCALTGEIREIKGVSNRNPNKELLIVGTAAILGIVAGIFIGTTLVGSFIDIFK